MAPVTPVSREAISICLLLAAFCARGACALEGDEQQREGHGIVAMIGISPEKQKYDLGDRIHVKCYLKNDSDKPVFVHNTARGYLWLSAGRRESALCSVSRWAGEGGGWSVSSSGNAPFFRSRYREIPVGAEPICVVDEDFPLSVPGEITVRFQYKSQYDYYYDSERLGEKKKLEGAWVGAASSSVVLQVGEEPPDGYLDELRRATASLEEEPDLEILRDLIDVAIRAPSHAAEFLLALLLDNRMQFSFKERMLVLDLVCKLTAVGDGYRVMDLLAGLLQEQGAPRLRLEPREMEMISRWNRRQLSLEERKMIRSTVAKCLEKGVATRRYSQYGGICYKFKDEVKDEIRKLVGEDN